MHAFLLSTVIVALAEIGDKTQLLSLVLAARFRQPVPIIAGIFVATALNHAGAAAIGAWLTALVGLGTLRWILGVSFLAMAIWMLIPDRIDDDALPARHTGVFATTTTAFFLAEMGDKTQFATIALAARFDAFVPVVIGTTLGMMLANVPAVLLGDRLAGRLPVRTVHVIAALVFAAIGVLALLEGVKAPG